MISVFGTRPEAIKMAPLVNKLRQNEHFCTKVIVTGQHREMLDQILHKFQIRPDYDLDIMQKKQTLSEMTCRIVTAMEPILIKEKPDLLLVHGDTTTTFSAALAAFYQKIKVGHVEAGLRTHQKWDPFPEEMNRQLTDSLTDIFFAPTALSKENLLNEGIEEKNIFVTGNTSIDTMVVTLGNQVHQEKLKQEKKKILVTMHRRENLGPPMESVFCGLKTIAQRYPAIEIIFPMHKNPAVRKLAREHLGNLPNVALIEPLDVFEFHQLVAQSYLILTDSGGIQEEAPALGIPVLVLRKTTERPEGVEAGTLKLIGTQSDTVYQEIQTLLLDSLAYNKMANAANPYGNGKASEKIIEALESFFQVNT